MKERKKRREKIIIRRKLLVNYKYIFYISKIGKYNYVT